MANQSMNDFLQQVGTILYRYLRKRGLAHEDAEDIVQDTCYKFLLHKNGIQSDKVMSWLYRVATNQFYDLKRKEKRHPTTEYDEVHLTALTNIPEIQVLKKEKLEDIRGTLETLSNLHQELLVLKYEMGLSYKEISALMNKNENTLKTHVKRAREEFTESFKEDTDYE
ncbi:RNA polymerase sigma factor, sigma-70 family protein [Lysinibacillus sphaericus]|uniref:RNA polymerase sigma factor n=1 Tax=Lysinibacillus sphaericus TaxID=1421 RepID=UPI0018CD5AE6|nr:RNA polymerase sigma factor [Lysinibacillus sphaericus]MBG9453594.1 RNA polymerase sigma factor, sigma-70 family protein [Lysinibacillus sphaericus]MBG9480264.1 RNA polymerase sigma factor, sigma-70 family protein [Lysinibacillus sphaericus]MBG9594943.1 RNA polymerase sigma factor, sigma-70 family protein [Lysinibacillus sphaericus]